MTAEAAAARDAFRTTVEAPGHAVDNVRSAVAALESAAARGDVEITPTLRQMLADLDVALEHDAGQKLGGKSAEAARFIARAIIHELDAQAAAA